jgi:type IV fimbrial biogenesis protein FimT
MKRNGFTLIDLMITLSVLSILLSVGIPSLSAQLQQMRVKSAVFALQEAINLTRTQAVSANKRATIRAQSEWESGWEVFIDKDNDGVRDSDEDIVLLREKLKGIRITANRPVKNYVSYIPTGESRNASGTNGGGFQAGTFTVCPTAKGKGVALVLARGGRVRVAEIDEEKCNSV